MKALRCYGKCHSRIINVPASKVNNGYQELLLRLVPCGSQRSLELESINYCSLKLAVKKFIDSAKDVDNDEHFQAI